MVTEVAVLLLGGLKLILGPGVFTVFDLLKMDVPWFWKQLARMTDLKSRWSGCQHERHTAPIAFAVSKGSIPYAA
eukprot:1139104-Pelagomonas_calceolata.AAC.7